MADDPRFIPAGAGNAIALFIMFLGLTVHPRRRGERWDAYVKVFARLGSSPQARGTPERRGRYRHQRRFIPAGAGNAPPQPVQSVPLTVHPRRRGERDWVEPT